VALVGFSAAILQHVPKISVYPEQTLDPKNAFAAPFRVSNEGYLDIHDLEFKCVIEKAVYGGDRLFLDNIKETHDWDNIRVMHPGGSRFVTCNSALRDETPNMIRAPWPLTHAVIRILVTFRPAFLPWRSQKEFRFHTVHSADEVVHWVP